MAKGKRHRSVPNFCCKRRKTNAEIPAASQTGNSVVDHSGSGNRGESGIILECDVEVSVSVVENGLGSGCYSGRVE
jgi:hypothetical protein